MPSTSTTAQFNREFQALIYHLWYANRFNLENKTAEEEYHRNRCIEICEYLQEIDNQTFSRKIYPFLPETINNAIFTG